MAHYTGPGTGNGEKIRQWAEVRVTVFCWLTYVGYVLHHWVSGRRGFQSAGHRDPAGRHKWWNMRTHLLYLPLSTHTCIPHTLLTFTLRFWLIERSGVLYWLHTFCVFKFTALSSTLSYTVDVFVFSVALWGDSGVGEVRPRQAIPGFINSWKTGAIRGKAQGSSSTSRHFRSPGPVVPLTASQHPWFV